LRLEFWTSFLLFFLNLLFFYLDDFVTDADRRAGNCIGKSIENWFDELDGNWVDEFDGNWVDEFEQHIDVKIIVLATQDQTDSKKN